MSVCRIISLSIIFTLLNFSPAFAYIGPGLGLGAIGIMLGVIGTLIIAIFAILYYPIKKLIKKIKSKKKTDQNLDSKN